MASESQVIRLVQNLEREFYRAIEQIVEGLRFGEQTAIESAGAVNSVLAALSSSGYGGAAGRLEAIYAGELRSIRDELSAITGERVPFTNFDRAGVEALLANNYQLVTKRLEEYGFRVQQVLIEQIITGQRPDIRQLRDVVGTRVFSNLETEIRTATIAFNRAQTIVQAESLGLELFEYAGPDDRVTRPFCDYLLGDSASQQLPKGASVPVVRRSRVYTGKEIRSMRNGQGLDALTFGGGYNCRHRWQPVTETRAKELGYPN